MNRRRYMQKRALSPLTVALTGATLGGALGAGASVWQGDESPRKPLIGALLGALPGLTTAVQQYARAYDDISLSGDGKLSILDPLLLDTEALREKSPSYNDKIESLIKIYNS